LMVRPMRCGGLSAYQIMSVNGEKSNNFFAGKTALTGTLD